MVTLLSVTLFISCQNTKLDPAPISGTINQSDEKTAIVVKLAKAYEEEVSKRLENILHLMGSTILILLFILQTKL